MTRPLCQLLSALLLAAGCSPTGGASALDQARALRAGGDRAGAYEALLVALCNDEASLEPELVELWDELGRPGTPHARLEACGVAGRPLAFVDALVATLLGARDEAERAFAAARDGAGGAQSAEVRYRAGLAALRFADPERARHELAEAAALAPARVDVRLALVSAEIMRRAAPEAVTTLRSVLMLSPNAAELGRARALLAQAVRVAEPPLEASVDQELKGWLGLVEQDKLAAADVEGALALAALTPHPRVLRTAGLVALKGGRQQQGRALLEAATTQSPLDPDAPRILGTSLHAAQRSDEARAYLEQASARDPFDAAVALIVARAAVGRGDAAAARDAFIRLRVLEPGVIDHRVALARLERQLGNGVAAAALLEQGLAAEPDNVPLLAELLAQEVELSRSAPTADAREKAKARATDAARRLLGVAPNHPGAQSMLER